MVEIVRESSYEGGSSGGTGTGAGIGTGDKGAAAEEKDINTE